MNLQAVDLEVGKHQLDVFSIALIHHSKSTEAPFPGRRFMLQQVIFERLPAHELASTAFLKALSSRFASFQLRHELRVIFQFGTVYDCSP